MLTSGGARVGTARWLKMSRRSWCSRISSMQAACGAALRSATSLPIQAAPTATPPDGPFRCAPPEPPSSKTSTPATVDLARAAAAPARHCPRECRGRLQDHLRPSGTACPMVWTRIARKRRCAPRCSAAGRTGYRITDVMTACGLGRGRVYYRLREHARVERAGLTTHGSWPAVGPGNGQPAWQPARAGRPAGAGGPATRVVTVSDRPFIHGLARACARRAVCAVDVEVNHHDRSPGPG
jgi:hypothetical protein